MKPDGIFIMIIPYSKGTFDYYRNVTTIEHIKNDYYNQTKENDMYHLEDAIKYHCLKRDFGSKSINELKFILSNHNNRALHHHVFDLQLAKELIKASGFELVGAELVNPADIIIIAKKDKKIYIKVK